MFKSDVGLVLLVISHLGNACASYPDDRYISCGC
jgi:hypothetical protein